MSESELKVKVFTQDELSTTLTMNEIAEYLEELPKLTAIGGASGNSKSSSSSSDSTKEHSNATSIHHADTLDLIILIGEIIVAMGDKEAKSKFVSGIVGLEFKVASAISDLKSKLESKKHKPTYHESHLSRTSFSAPKNN